MIVNKKDRVDVYRQKNGSRNRLALISKLYDSEHVYTAEALVTGGIVAYKVGIVVEDRQAVVLNWQVLASPKNMIWNNNPFNF